MPNQRELARQALRIQKGRSPTQTEGYWKPRRMAEAKARILDELITGKTLKSCLRHRGKGKKIMNPEMPTMSTFLGWLTIDKEFEARYSVALEHRADALADEITDIADDERLSPESRKVRINARQWAAGKLKPRRYGDKITHEGEVHSTTEVIISAGASLDARLRRLLQPQTIDVTPTEKPDAP